MGATRLEMRGLSQAAMETNGLPAGSVRVEIVYSESTDTVRAYTFADGNSWVKVDDEDVIIWAETKMTTKGIRRRIKEKLKWNKEHKKEIDEYIAAKQAYLEAPWLYD